MIMKTLRRILLSLVNSHLWLNEAGSQLTEANCQPPAQDMKWKYYTAIATLMVCLSCTFAQDTVRYVKVPAGYLMVLKPGDDVLQQLTRLARTEYIPSASFSGMGFVNVKFGYFNFARKQYKPKQFNKAELTNMLGSIAWDDTGNVSIHAHGTIAGKNFKARGGHILEMTVSTGTLEILVVVHDRKFLRRKDEHTGANMLQLDR
jgi:uncharacterized protein